MVGGIGRVTLGIGPPVPQSVESPARAAVAENSSDAGSAREPALEVQGSFGEASEAWVGVQVSLLKEGLDLGRALGGQIVSMINGVKAYGAASGEADFPPGAGIDTTV